MFSNIIYTMVIKCIIAKYLYNIYVLFEAFLLNSHYFEANIFNLHELIFLIIIFI